MFDEIHKKVLDIKDLAHLRQAHKGQKIVFCSGCYDVMHVGHAIFFADCKKEGDIFVVSVGRDEVIRKLKGPYRPINSERNRVHMVAALEQVDYAVLGDTTIGEGKIDFANTIEQLRPDIFILNDDDSAIIFKKALCEKWGIKLVLVKRWVPDYLEAGSSTKIINASKSCKN